MLCLKDPQTKNDTIHQELLLTVSVIYQNNVTGVLATQKTRTLHQQLTIIYCSMFRLHTVARKRGKESVRVHEQTQETRPLLSSSTELSECKLLTDNWSLFENSLIFIYLNSGYRWGWCYLVELLSYLSSVQNSLFIFLQSNLSQKRYESILFTFWPSIVERYVLA